jgi:hypothetical protein
MSARTLRRIGCVSLAWLACACAAPRPPAPVPTASSKEAAGRAAGAPAAPGKLDAPAAPPRWDDPAAVKYIWAQGAGLADAKVLCPYAFPTEDLGARHTSARYETEAQTGPFALHLSFQGAPGIKGSWGVGCLRRYDVSRYLYLSVWIKAQAGQRVRFRLRDQAGAEAVVEKEARAAGWQRVVIPTADFAGVDLRALTNFGLVFDEDLGGSDLYLDDLEFTNQ